MIRDEHPGVENRIEKRKIRDRPRRRNSFRAVFVLGKLAGNNTLKLHVFLFSYIADVS